MPFTDSLGREWTPVFNTLTLARCEQALGVNLLAAAADGTLQTAMFGSFDALVKSLCASVESEMRARNVTREELLFSLNGNALRQAAECLGAAIRNYWPEPEPNAKPNPTPPLHGAGEK